MAEADIPEFLVALVKLLLRAERISIPGMRNIRAASKLWQHFISDKNLLYKEETVPIRWKSSAGPAFSWKNALKKKIRKKLKNVEKTSCILEPFPL